MKQEQYQNMYINSGDRFFFFPFLTGAVVGGAAVGLTRPRPIYNVAPQQQMMPNPAYPYGYTSYGYYYPYPYNRVTKII